MLSLDTPPVLYTFRPSHLSQPFLAPLNGLSSCGLYGHHSISGLCLAAKQLTGVAGQLQYFNLLTRGRLWPAYLMRAILAYLV